MIKVFKRDNYIVVESGGIPIRIPKAQSRFSESDSILKLQSDGQDYDFSKYEASQGTYVDEAGTTPYSLATLIEFLELNSAFNSAGQSAIRNYILVQELADFPAPVNDVITLNLDDYQYQINSSVDIGINRIEVSASGVRMEGVGSAQLISTTTDDLITVVSGGDLYMDGIDFVGLTASCLIDFTGDVDKFFIAERCTFIGGSCGVNSHSGLAMALILCQFVNVTNPIYISGNVDNIRAEQVLFSNCSGTFIDLNGAVTPNVTIEGCVGSLGVGTTFIEMLVDNGNLTPTTGVGSIDSCRLTDDGGTYTTGYSPLDIQWRVAGNTGILDSDRLIPNGWEFFVDSLATPTQVLSSTPAALSIDSLGATTNSAFAPRLIRGTGITQWDESTSRVLAITEGDSFDMRVQLTLLSATVQANDVTLVVDIGATPDGTGGAGSIIIARDSKNISATGGGLLSSLVFTFPLFALSTFKANGATLFLVTDDGTVTVGGRDILIVRTASGAS